MSMSSTITAAPGNKPAPRQRRQAPGAGAAFNPIPTIVASSAMFLACMDTLITNLALPTIEAELGGGMVAQQWVVDGYTLPFAVLLLLAGNLSDRFGAKRAFVVGTAGFALSSVICSAAGTIGALIFGRAVMGVAAALILPSSMALINEAYRDEASRRRALAVWGVGGSASAAAGPLLGGLLVPIHWSLVFSINIPVCLVVLALCTKIERSPQVPAPIDFVGQVLAVIGLTGIAGGIIESGAEGFGAPLPLALLTIGAIGTVAFLISQAHVAHPMMPLALFESHGMRLALLGGFAIILNWNGLVFVTTLFLQQAQGLSPIVSGLAFVPSAITSTVGNLLSDRLSGQRGVRFTILLGVCIIASCYALMMAGSAVGALSTWLIALAVSLAGLGGGMTTPSLAGLVLKSVSPEQSGIASAVFNTLRQVGGAIGIALFGAFVTIFNPMTAGLAVSFTLSLILLAAVFAVAVRPTR